MIFWHLLHHFTSRCWLHHQWHRIRDDKKDMINPAIWYHPVIYHTTHNAIAINKGNINVWYIGNETVVPATKNNKYMKAPQLIFTETYMKHMTDFILTIRFWAETFWDALLDSRNQVTSMIWFRSKTSFVLVTTSSSHGNGTVHAASYQLSSSQFRDLISII